MEIQRRDQVKESTALCNWLDKGVEKTKSKRKSRGQAWVKFGNSAMASK